MPVVGKDANLMPYDNSTLGDVLNTVLSAGKNKIQDKMWRESFKKSLGISGDGYTLKELMDMDKKRVEESFKQKEWKPQDEESATRFEAAKAGFKNAQDLKKDYAKYVVESTKNAAPIKTFSEYKKLFDETVENPDAVAPAAPAAPESTGYDPNKVKAWGVDVPWWRRMMAAVTPGPIEEERKLGGLRVGGIFDPNTVDKQRGFQPAALPGESAPVAAAPAAPVSQYTPEEESLITEHMIEFGRSRDEVIAALIARGMLKGQ